MIFEAMLFVVGFSLGAIMICVNNIRRAREFERLLDEVEEE